VNRLRQSVAAAAFVPLALMVAAAIALAACGNVPSVGSSGPPASRAPSTPAGSPDASPSPSSPPQPSDPVRPADPPDDAADGVDQLHLVNWPGVDSAVIVWDETATLVDAASGTPDRDGPVAADVVEVQSIADDAIRLTWSDLPIDDRVQVRIDTVDSRYRIVVLRPGSDAPSDGVVSDRVLELRFRVAVPVSDIDASVIQRRGATIGEGYINKGLASSDGSSLTLSVWDETDLLAGASLEGIDKPASHQDRKVRIRNLTSDTVRITWADPAAPTDVRMSFRLASDGQLSLRILRLEPPGPTTPVAVDRVIDITFHGVVLAEDLTPEVIDGSMNG
jgi:hypothetical protein